MRYVIHCFVLVYNQVNVSCHIEIPPCARLAVLVVGTKLVQCTRTLARHPDQAPITSEQSTSVSHFRTLSDSYQTPS